MQTITNIHLMNIRDICYDVMVIQINYHSLKQTIQDGIDQAKSSSHENVLVQIFMLNAM